MVHIPSFGIAIGYGICSQFFMAHSVLKGAAGSMKLGCSFVQLRLRHQWVVEFGPLLGAVTLFCLVWVGFEVWAPFGIVYIIRKYGFQIWRPM